MSDTTPFFTKRNMFGRIALFILPVFLVYSLVIPSQVMASKHSPPRQVDDCETVKKIDDFLSFQVSREFLASVGETPESIMKIVRCLDETQRADFWSLLEPLHPVSIAVEIYVEMGYERTTAEALVAELTTEELDELVQFDQLTGGYHHGGFWMMYLVVTVAIIAVIAIALIFVIRELRDDRSRANIQPLNAPDHLATALRSHFRELRSNLGLERTNKPTF